MTTKTLPPKGQSRRKVVNRKEDDVPGFPSLTRDPHHQYTTADIAWIINGGERADSSGRKTRRQRMGDEATRNWLTGAHAKGEIDDAQLEMFWPGDRG